ncbi:hypothetical protein BH09BAC3_BH09BAC3_10820 [soil metagenome]
MKKVKLILTMVLVAGMVSLFLEACKSDSTTVSPLKLVSLKTGSGTSLDGATSATDIATNSTVVATFDKEIDATSANTNSIALVINGVAVPATVTAAGAAVTITPTAALANGTNYKVSVAVTLKGKDGSPAPATEFTFKTFGRANVTPPQSSNQVSYFSFSGNVNDEVGTHTPVAGDVKNLTFAADRFGFAGLAGDFNGTTTIVEIPNGEQYVANNDFTLSFWIKANSTKAGQFVLGLGAWKGFQFELADDWSNAKLANQYNLGASKDSEDNWFPGTGETKDNGGWQGWTFQKDVLPHGGGVGTTYFKDKWCHVICTYQASTKLATMYLNGEKVKQHDFNLWPDGDAKKGALGVTFAGNLTGGGNKLALGFIQGIGNPIITDSWAQYADPLNKHFKGQMDDVRLFKVALTAAEVTTLYTAEKP